MIALSEALKARGSQPALRQGDLEWTGSTLLQQADTLIHTAKALHCQRFMVCSSRPLEVLVALLAAEQCQASLFVAHPTFSPEQLADLAQAQGLQHALLEGAADLEQRWNHLPPLDFQASQTPEAARVHVMTSGTTGQPKLAEHSLETLTGTIRRAPGSQEAVWMLTYPPSSFAGLQVLLSAVLGGGQLVAPEARTPQGFVQAAVAGKVSHISGTPTFWRAFLLALPPHLTLPIRQITLGGEAVDEGTLQRLTTRFPQANVRQIYASTEAGVLFTVADGRAGLPASWLETGVGGVSLCLREGVLYVRSPRAMRRYASSHASPLGEDGWLCTGDVVEVVGDRLLFRGRADRGLNVGGYKVRPEEVEAALLLCPEVGDARVYGTPSPLTGQVVVAEVVPRGDMPPAELKSLLGRVLRERLEAYKVPRVIRVVEAISTTAFGKKARQDG